MACAAAARGAFVGFGWNGVGFDAAMSWQRREGRKEEGGARTLPIARFTFIG
jgi:hypothetical protein